MPPSRLQAVRCLSVAARTAAMRIEPAATLSGPVQSGGNAAGLRDGLLNLSGETGCTGAYAASAAYANPRTATIPDVAGPESEIVVIACHDITIGSRTKACKGEKARVVAGRRKGRSGVAAGGLAFERRRSEH